MTEEQITFAFLGPEGTYSDEATRIFAARMGIDDPRMMACTSFSDIFDSVTRGKCAYGVVPVENALEGPVTATLDSFAFNLPTSILGEQVVDIHHCLVAHPDATMEDIETVVSHAQGLAQCRRFLTERLPGRKTITTSSTAESARLASQDKSVAGIANAYAAKIHGAKVLVPEIEDHYGNQTVFTLIGRQGAPAVYSGDNYKTSLALFLQADKAGALLMILSEFAYAGINLTKIQSRPTKQVLGEYMFFIDIEGSVNDPAVQTALNCLRLKLREVKILGSYPVE